MPFVCDENFFKFNKLVFSAVLFRSQAFEANKHMAIHALIFAVLVLMRFTFWINQGRLLVLESNYSVLFIIIRNMFSNTGLAKFNMTKVTVALYYSGLTKVTPDHILCTDTWIHFYVESGNTQCTYAKTGD